MSCKGIRYSIFRLFCSPYTSSYMIQCLYTFTVFLLAIACASVRTDDTLLKKVNPLPDQLQECSGLISIGNDTFIGLNDSGNPAELIIFSLAAKSTTHVVKIKGAVNHDWEELTADDQFIYISDTGNNAGTRKDLAIYRVNKDRLIKEDEVVAEQISFNYPEQTSFLPAQKHNFDCEAMVCVGDSLYLFTKNRKNHKTDLYSLPKIPGTFKATHRGEFDAQGLVTGAAFRSSAKGNELALVGYADKQQGYHPFILYFDQVDGTRFFDAVSKRFTFTGTEQTETILFYDDRHVYISNEGEHGDQPFVYQVDVKN